MADASITKQALASSLKALMQEMSFSKISISHICDRCSMNRQSFYYHFRDKYELLNWIFDMDFLELLQKENGGDRPEGIVVLCNILYANRDFYRSAFSVQGQNSLADHVREIALPLMKDKLAGALPDDDPAFYLDFFLDVLLGAIFRWIMDANPEPPETFIPHFFSCILSMAKYITKKYDL
ncbi:MAG: TetR/AcrR family transcriptional regulator C-terminal domain-containing protein [Clostridia bacterium]|nr:TetR/AcrR family transcriptional regulator C-terminal domain-containing protein [Clostridia bacterium]